MDVNNNLNMQNNNGQEIVQNQEVLNNDNLVNNNQEVKKKNSNKIVIILIIVLILLVISVLGYFIIFKKDNVTKDDKKEVVKTIYFYESTDRKYPKRIWINATDDKKDTESDEFNIKKMLNTYECETACEIDYAYASPYIAIYDGKLIQYNEENNTFENINKTKEYKFGEYKFSTYGEWIVGEYNNQISVGYNYNNISIRDEVTNDVNYEIQVTLNTLVKNAYMIIDNTAKTPFDEYHNLVKASIYKDNQLFFEKNILEDSYPYFDIKGEFYIVENYDDSFALTEDKKIIENYMFGNDHSVYNDNLIVSHEHSIFVYDKNGELISKTPYTYVGSVYDNYAFVINNGELHLINALDNQIIYNFGTIKSREHFCGYDHVDSYESDYIIKDNSKKIWIFLEDDDDPQYMIGAYENGDNVFGRRFTYDFNTGEGSIEKSSTYSEQNT